MKSTFGTKLFRLLLLFALVPSILLSLAGYYMITETAEWSVTTNDGHFKNLTDYYNNLTFKLIEQDLRTISENKPEANFLDFVFSNYGKDKSNIYGNTLLSTESKRKISSAVTRADKGKHALVEIDSLVYQCSYIKDSTGRIIIGGIIHGPEYSQLLTAYQKDIAARSSLGKLQHRYAFFLSLVFAVMAFLTVMFAYLFSRRISHNLSRPLTELAQATRAVAMGDFKQTVKSTGTGEIRTLIESFNRMASRLDDTTARLTQTERVAAWRHIARRFAHELKNPLQPIMISLYRIEKVLHETSSFEEIKQPLKAASEELKHLTDLADRFSQLAKLPPPTLKRTDLNRLLTSVAELYREQLSSYNFSLNLPTDSVYVKIDKTYFREALHNLLQNAMEATPKGKLITLSLTASHDEAQISLQDEGTGMTDEVVSSARIPYFTTKPTGNGLGLAIVEKTVNEHGGRLAIESLPSQGIVVIIYLPLSTELYDG